MENKAKEVSIPDENFTLEQFEKGHSITSDTALLVETIKTRFQNCSSGKSVLDIGTGTGIICFMLGSAFPNWKIDGVEIQAGYFDLCLKNKENYSRFHEGRSINFFHNDIMLYSHDVYDIIVSNPPYIKAGSGRLGNSESRMTARHEISLNMQGLAQSIKRLLDKDGKAYILYPCSRKTEFESECKKAGLDIIDYIPLNEAGEHKQAILFEVSHAGI